MATECVDYDLALLFEFPCQVRRYQPPFENLLLGIDERIGILLVDLACTDEFPDHLVLPIKHMQIRNAFCPCLSVHIFKFYIRQGGGGFDLLLCSWAVYMRFYNLGLIEWVPAARHIKRRGKSNTGDIIWSAFINGTIRKLCHILIKWEKPSMRKHEGCIWILYLQAVIRMQNLWTPLCSVFARSARSITSRYCPCISSAFIK